MGECGAAGGGYSPPTWGEWTRQRTKGVIPRLGRGGTACGGEGCLLRLLFSALLALSKYFNYFESTRIPPTCYANSPTGGELWSATKNRSTLEDRSLSWGKKLFIVQTLLCGMHLLLEYDANSPTHKSLRNRQR